MVSSAISSCLLTVIFTSNVFFSSLNPVEAVLQDELCPPALRRLFNATRDCSLIKCVSTLRQRDCPEGSMLENQVTACGCCPGCVKYKAGFEDDEKECEEGANTDNYDHYEIGCSTRICAVNRNCRRGLICERDASDNRLRCVTPHDFPIQPTYPECKGRCSIMQAIAEKYNWEWQWETACAPDGYFNPIQCKGTRYRGDCYCVDKCGTRIFGRQRWDRAAAQTCECSRKVHELKSQGRISTIHCTEEGNYEPLQCDTDSDLCYCVDPATGKMTGEVLPDHQWKNLPCYNSSAPNFANDGNYLRRCESEWATAKKVAIEANLHGLSYDSQANKLACDYDGSFAPKHTDTLNSRELCVHKNGDQIAAYFRNLVPSPPMDCNCARDSVYYSLNGISTRQCDDGLVVGNYKAVYVNGNTATCVDSDGYSFGTQEIDSTEACCLERVVDSNGIEVSTCPPSDPNMCDGIIPCKDYKFVRDHYTKPV